MLSARSTYWRAMTGFRRRAAGIVGLQVLSGLIESVALATIVPLLYSGAGTDQGRLGELIADLGLTGRSGRYVVLGAFFVLGLLAVVFKFLGETRVVKLRNDIEASLRKRITNELLGMRWSSFISMRLGDIHKAVLLEGSETAAGSQAFVYAIGSAFVIVIYIGLALFLAPLLTFVALGFGGIVGLGYRWVGKRAEEQTRQQGLAAGEIADRIAVVFGNLKFFRSTGTTSASRKATLDAYKDYSRTYYRSLFYGTVMRAAFDSMAVVLISAILAVAIITTGQLTPESLVFLGVFYRLVPQLMSVQDRFYKAKSLRPWFYAWEERMEVASANQDRHVGTVAPSFDRELAFDHVDFTFPNTDRGVLDDVSWRMQKGECVAIVGESGVGKTTLLDIVTGLLTPVSGVVTVDDVPLTDVDLEAWQGKIGVVLQESPLFHGSVLENIAWMDATPDIDKAWYCARLAHAESFITELPEGMDTTIGEKGARLSGGQRQRVALARALYRDPLLLVLDEATSALDGQSEAVVQKALESIKGTCSMLIVTHRIKTVEMADRIYVLDKGKIVEQGDWDALLSTPGMFYEMASRQGLVRAA